MTHDPYDMIPVVLAERQTEHLLSLQYASIALTAIEMGFATHEQMVELLPASMAKFNAKVEEFHAELEERQARHERGECSCFQHDGDEAPVQVAGPIDDIAKLLEFVFNLPDADEPPILDV
jgi:hypothetical protein